jgi:hypothetical protein
MRLSGKKVRWTTNKTRAIAISTTRDLCTDGFGSPLDDGSSPEVDWASFGGGGKWARD